MSDFNGWTNKETWLVNLWLGDSLAMDQEEGINIDAEYIESLVEEVMAADINITHGFIMDLLNCALGEINYHELTNHYR